MHCNFSKPNNSIWEIKYKFLKRQTTSIVVKSCNFKQITPLSSGCIRFKKKEKFCISLNKSFCNPFNQTSCIFVFRVLSFSNNKILRQWMYIYEHHLLNVNNYAICQVTKENLPSRFQIALTTKMNQSKSETLIKVLSR